MKTCYANTFVLASVDDCDVRATEDEATEGVLQRGMLHAPAFEQSGSKVESDTALRRVRRALYVSLRRPTWLPRVVVDS